MRVLIIGFGSIGKRHCEVLSEFNSIKQVDLVTKQIIENRTCYKNLEEVKNINKYDYFVIASETKKHYEQLIYLDNILKNKKIFCEKPLFEKKQDFKQSNNNKIFIGYVLRFHPLMQECKNRLKNETIISANIKCGQYLPNWRSGTDYRKSYSASRAQGGGVLLDLRHEIDYTQWLFGKIEDIKSYQVKVSDLEIDSDDLTMLLGKTIYATMINLSIDYISKITHRKIIVETLMSSFEVDLIKNRLNIIDKDGNTNLIEEKTLERNDMFRNMHRSIINNENINSTLDEAMDIMNIIGTIQGQNNG